jgi:hypothetical protein
MNAFVEHHKDSIRLNISKPQAVTATAHKLARIIFHVLSTKGTIQRERVP